MQSPPAAARPAFESLDGTGRFRETLLGIAYPFRRRPLTTGSGGLTIGVHLKVQV